MQLVRIHSGMLVYCFEALICRLERCLNWEDALDDSLTDVFQDAWNKVNWSQRGRVKGCQHDRIRETGKPEVAMEKYAS